CGSRRRAPAPARRRTRAQARPEPGPIVPPWLSTLDADERLDARDLARKARRVGRIDDRRDVLVGLGRLFRNASHGRAPDDDPPLREPAHDRAALVGLERLAAAHRAAGAVAGGA